MAPGMKQVGYPTIARYQAPTQMQMGLTPAQLQAMQNAPVANTQPDPYALQQLQQQQVQLQSNSPVDKVLNWFNGLPLWGKVLAGAAALGGVFVGGRFVIKNAGGWGTQISRAFKPAPMGSGAVKEAKYNLHDSRAETKSLKNQLEQLEKSLLNHENAVNQAEVRVKRLGPWYRRCFSEVPFVYTATEKAELQAARRSRDAAKASHQTTSASLEQLTSELNRAKVAQYNAHLELLEKATAAKIVKREQELNTARKRLKECEETIANTKDAKTLDGLRETKQALEKKVSTYQARLDEAERIHNHAKGLESVDARDIDVTNTGHATSRRNYRTGGVAVQHRSSYFDPSTNTDYKKATVSPNVRDDNGNIVPMSARPDFGRIGPIEATSTRNNGIPTNSDFWSSTTNGGQKTINGVYRYAQPNFFEWLLGKRPWTMPVRYLTGQDYMTDSQVTNPSGI